MSSKPLTEAQEKLLAHRPNFAVTPRSPPIGGYIAAIKRSCQSLEQGEAEELRAEVKAVVKKSQTPRHNITREEQKALKELKEDKTRVVLTADMDVCMVALDTEEYIKKAEELLNQDSYKIILADPTTKQNKLVTLLKNIKAEGGINEDIYKRLYPTGAGTPTFYGLPKIHKAGIPLRPTVSSRGAVSYGTAKELARILKPLVGKSAYNVQNTRDFVQQLKNIKLQPNECIISYDVKALFTSVPIEPAIEIIRKHLEDDKDLPTKNINDSKVHHLSVGVLPKEHLFHLSRQAL